MLKPAKPAKSAFGQTAMCDTQYRDCVNGHIFVFLLRNITRSSESFAQISRPHRFYFSRAAICAHGVIFFFFYSRGISYFFFFLSSPPFSASRRSHASSRSSTRRKIKNETFLKTPRVKRRRRLFTPAEPDLRAFVFFLSIDLSLSLALFATGPDNYIGYSQPGGRTLDR